MTWPLTSPRLAGLVAVYSLPQLVAGSTPIHTFSLSVQVYLGIYIAHGSPTYNLQYNQWLIPVAVVMGCMVLADISLTIVK